MNRLITLVSGLTLVVVAVVGCVDAARDDRISGAVLFGLLALGIAAVTLGRAAAVSRCGATLPRGLTKRPRSPASCPMS